jgi:predicted transcriptional regulator
MWLDTLIQGEMDRMSDDGMAQAIAQSIASDPHFIAAIKRGLAKKPEPGRMGLSWAQIIATELQDEMVADEL